MRSLGRLCRRRGKMPIGCSSTPRLKSSLNRRRVSRASLAFMTEMAKPAWMMTQSPRLAWGTRLRLTFTSLPI